MSVPKATIYCHCRSVGRLKEREKEGEGDVYATLKFESRKSRKRRRSIETDLAAVDIARVEEVEGQGGDKVDEEPTFDVIHGYALAVAHHLALPAHVCRPEVEHDVCEQRESGSEMSLIRFLDGHSGRDTCVMCVARDETSVGQMFEMWEFSREVRERMSMFPN